MCNLSEPIAQIASLISARRDGQRQAGGAAECLEQQILDWTDVVARIAFARSTIALTTQRDAGPTSLSLQQANRD